ncbi:MAG: DUF2007 domain-containing protein [Gemmatimonadota bacterium]
MKMIASFSYADLPFAQYLKAVLEEGGIGCLLRNENLALTTFSERAAGDISPELWVDDARAEEAASIVREVRAGEAERSGTEAEVPETGTSSPESEGLGGSDPLPGDAR